MDYIKISGFKSIKDEKITLMPINILIGANGAGKSNFISFFDFVNRLSNGSLQEYTALRGGADKLLHKGQKTTENLSFTVEFDNGNNGYSVNLKAGITGFIFTQEKLMYRNTPDRDITNFGTEANLKLSDNDRARHIIYYLDGLRKYHFHDTSSKSPFSKLSHVENDIYYLYSDGSNLAAFISHIRKKDKIVYNRIIKTIQSVAPFFSDFVLIPNDESFIRLQWKDKFSDSVYGVTDLSDGTLRFISLTVLFLQPNLPDTIIIDEPELGLHPIAIAKLAGMIKSASLKGCQVIIATQSTDLISHFTPDSVITVDQIDGCSKFERLNEADLKEWLTEYSLDDLWKRNILTAAQPNH